MQCIEALCQHRRRGVFLLSLWLAFVSGQLRAQTQTDVLTRARQLLQAGQHRQCIELLESGTAPRTHDADRLVLLCTAYRALIKEALRRRDQLGVETLVQRLRVYESRLAGLEAADLTSGVRQLPSVGTDAQSGRPSGQPQRNEAQKPPSAQPRPTSGGWRPRGTIGTGVPPQQRAVSAVKDPRAVNTPAHARSQPAEELVRQADAAFGRKEYDAAQKLYAAAYRSKSTSLSPAAVRRWAYCRLTAVVKLVNQGPRDTAEWKAAERELADVLQLLLRRGSAKPEDDPLVRYTRFLMDVVKRRQGPRTKSPEMIRAAEPDRPTNKSSGLLEKLRRPYPAAPTRPARPSSDANARVSTQRVRTQNFILVGSDPQLLRAVAPRLEQIRTDVGRFLLAGERFTPWRPPCVVRFHDRSSGPAPAVSTVQLEGGRVTARVVDVFPEALDQLDAVLRHELAHVWLSGVYRPAPVPEWLDEGLAILVEPADRFVAHLRNLRSFEQRQPVMATALIRNRPLPQAVRYAASASLCRFLLDRYGRDTLLRFAAVAQRSGLERAARDVLNLRSARELEDIWQRARSAQYQFAGLN